jgi:putative restriction endonuclease
MKIENDLTYIKAIEQVMLQNGYFAPLKLLYKEIWNFKDKSKISGLTPNQTIQEKVQRDPRFTRIANGVYALTDFLEEVEKEDLGFFTIDKDEVVFNETKKLIKAGKIKEFINTEKVVKQKVRIGQSYFRKKLLAEMKSCPITGINDERFLIASHIKPWIYSNNQERVNPKNGLLLSPLFDKLFDKGTGLITFTLDKRILLSKSIKKENAAKLHICNNQVIENLDISGREEFLEYHRKFIFQG